MGEIKTFPIEPKVKQLHNCLSRLEGLRFVWQTRGRASLGSASPGTAAGDLRRRAGPRCLCKTESRGYFRKRKAFREKKVSSISPYMCLFYPEPHLRGRRRRPRLLWHDGLMTITTATPAQCGGSFGGKKAITEHQTPGGFQIPPARQRADFSAAMKGLKGRSKAPALCGNYFFPAPCFYHVHRRAAGERSGEARRSAEAQIPSLISLGAGAAHSGGTVRHRRAEKLSPRHRLVTAALSRPSPSLGGDGDRSRGMVGAEPAAVGAFVPVPPELRAEAPPGRCQEEPPLCWSGAAVGTGGRGTRGRPWRSASRCAGGDWWGLGGTGGTGGTGGRCGCGCRSN